MKDRILIGLLGFAVLFGSAFVNKGCTSFQAEQCRNRGGEPITRYFDMEYTGCINAN